MKLSDFGEVYSLASRRQNLVGMLIDLEDIVSGSFDDGDGDPEPEVEVTVHGWQIDIPVERIADIVEIARDRCVLEIADVERKLAALGVEIDAEVADAAMEDA